MLDTCTMQVYKNDIYVYPCIHVHCNNGPNNVKSFYIMEYQPLCFVSLVMGIVNTKVGYF